MRRSSRLRAKKRVNYNEDNLWERAVKRAGGVVKKAVDRLAPDPSYRRQRPAIPRQRAPQFRKKRLFRPKLAPQKPRIPKELVRVRSDPPSRIERDEDVIEMIDLTGEERIARVVDRRVEKQNPIKRIPRIAAMSDRRKHLLFMNPGDEKIMEAAYALAQGGFPPKWAQPFRRYLVVRSGRLHWRENDRGGVLELPFATTAEKRKSVKHCYFDPREPSTIEAITGKLRAEWANISKRNVTSVLRSLVTYQRNFGRRRPPDIKNRMFLNNPGMIAMDMFFPSVNDGWERYSCLTCMDSWSRFVGIYAIATKKYADVLWAMRDFLAKFASMGHLPRRILSDRGTDMAGAKDAIEPYRAPRDGVKPMVLHSAAGTPVLIVEGMNAQVQRRMQIFRTSGLIDSPAQILHEITIQINNEPRQARGGLTPIQLLALDTAGRKLVNDQYRQRESPQAEVHGLRTVVVGDWVRLLLMTRKEQETNKMKGFTAKWSKEIYEVFKKTALRKNAFMFRYDIGLPTTYYRHELLKIPKQIDPDVPQGLVRPKEVSVGSEYVPGGDDEEWDRSDVESD